MAKSDIGSNIVFLLAGVAIGAVGALLLTPRTGQETRRRIRELAGEGRDVVRERARQARDQAGGWADKGREYLNSQKDQIRSAYEAGRQDYHESSELPGEETTPDR